MATKINLPWIFGQITTAQLTQKTYAGTTYYALDVTKFDDNFNEIKNKVNRLFDIKTITTDYTPTADDYVLVCNPTAAITITLPTPSTIVSSGETKEFIIVNVSSYTVTVNTTDAGSINLSQNQKLYLFTEGTNWFFGNYWAKNADNADTVDTFHASQTPTANTIPVAGSDGKLDSGWFPSVGGTRMAIFTSSTLWTVPAGVSTIYVMAVGGGGGGGGAKGYYDTVNGTYYRAVAAGGMGGRVVFTQINVTAGDTLTITVGAGGAGGATTPTAGGNGGTSSIANSAGTVLVSASGGIGGGAAAAPTSPPYKSVIATTGVIGCPFVVGGHGQSILGPGGIGGYDAANGTNASYYGSGGGGAASKDHNHPYAGGAGSSGIIIIWY